MSNFEIEQKYAIGDADRLQAQLIQRGARPGPIERHADTYFNHPSRDFAATKEALRIRRIDGIPHITFKGPKLPGPIKARREMEWRLDPGDPDGAKTIELWKILGFREVATVHKVRHPFQWKIPWEGDTPPIVITVDRVAGLGDFAEVELIADEDDVEWARRRVEAVAASIGLSDAESRSYLRMQLEAG